MPQTDILSVCGHQQRTPPMSSSTVHGLKRIPPRRCNGRKTRMTKELARQDTFMHWGRWTTCQWRWTAPCWPTGRCWGAWPSTQHSLQERRSCVRLFSVSMLWRNEPLIKPEMCSCWMFYVLSTSEATEPHWDSSVSNDCWRCLPALSTLSIDLTLI